MVATSRRWLAPEVVQSSAMDCGPATLKCLLEGYGVPVSYGRLREACQTDVDGTSIDTMEEVASELGLEAEQILLPADHLLLPEAKALPAIVVVRLANGVTHFVVVWRERFGFVQVMDPGHGRRFVSRERFFQDLYEHVMEVPAAGWREWAGSEEARECFSRRLRDIGFGRDEAARRVERACKDPSFESLAVLDAAARAVRALQVAGAGASGKLFDELYEEATKDRGAALESIPLRFWSVRPVEGDASTPEEVEEQRLQLRGAVLVRIKGKVIPAEAEVGASQKLSPELRAALEEPPPRPGAALWKALRADGSLTLASLGAALLGAAATLVLEALLFRSLLDVAPYLNLSGQRLGAIAAVAVFMLLVLALELGITRGSLRLGRKLEARLRIAFQEKIPRLADRYFASRLTSDMAERQHSLHTLRQLAPMGALLLRASFELVLTAVGIVWLEPRAALLAVSAAVLSLALPYVALPHLLERDLRVRSHVAGLSRFYLDALLGLVPIRLHGAARAVRSEHEALLTEWARARLTLQRFVVGMEGGQFVIGFGLATWLLLAHLDRGGELGTVLLLAYWALNVPVLGLEVMELARRYPEHRNVMLRLLEPIGAPEEEQGASPEPGSEETLPPSGVAIELSGVDVKASGHPILSGLDLSVAPGSHVAIVGPSGAGKSTLLGLFLGWHRPSAGVLRVDGEVLEALELARLRSETAWVDPSVQIWNRSFIDNLRYGSGVALSDGRLAEVIQLADLRPVLELLPDGHQSSLGEGGGLVSGGEGQRVRLARGLLRNNARLVLLDEPFRGLDRSTRRQLLARARAFWKDATLLCVTHDLADTRTFDAVAVLESGRIVEAGTPDSLANRKGSRYEALLEAHDSVERLFAESSWRRLHLESGRLRSETRAR